MDYPLLTTQERGGRKVPRVKGSGFYWVAVKELTLSYYIGETLLLTLYTHYGNLI